MSQEKLSRDFALKRYVQLEQLVSVDVMALYFEYAKNYARVPNYFCLETDTRSLGRYADALGEVLLTRLMPTVERCAKVRLHPTYSFLRFYTPESRLARHTDRPSCQYTLTVTVGHEGAQASWPILLESGGCVESVALSIGDALLFQGTVLPHWRDPLPAGNWLQLFLHYVDADGPQAGHQFDGRRHVGPIQRYAL